MKKPNSLFWNVDTQEDFIDQAGKLAVPGAESIRPILSKLTEFAKAEGIRVVNTCDYHYIHAEEISEYPDFQTTFPPHCLAGTPGAEFIAETAPENPLIIEWEHDLAIFAEFDNPELFRNIVIRKNAFDVFAGNPHTEKVLGILHPDQVFVYGVTTNVCVDKAVMGLLARGYKVFVLEDAIKELPNIPLPFQQWEKGGAKRITFAEMTNLLG